jgi:hypothetical protein
VKSEHCVGFIKGRFCSLRGLRVQINQVHQLSIATFWITACIAVHTYAMSHEAGTDITSDDFFREGLRIVEEERITRMDGEAAPAEIPEVTREVALLEGKVKREELKHALLARLDYE